MVRIRPVIVDMYRSALYPLRGSCQRACRPLVATRMLKQRLPYFGEVKVRPLWRTPPVDPGGTHVDARAWPRAQVSRRHQALVRTTPKVELSTGNVTQVLSLVFPSPLDRLLHGAAVGKGMVAAKPDLS